MIREHLLDVDALLMGGGVAGCFAARELARRGRSVLVCDKTPIRRSGNAGMGIDHWLTSSPLVGAQTDNPDLFREMEQAMMAGFLSCREDVHDISTIGAEAAVEALEILHDVEAMGVPVRNDAGELHLVKRSGGTSIWIRGGEFKTRLAEETRRLGARPLEHAMVTDLLTAEDGTVCGAVAFHSRTGTLYVIRARSVLVATGRTSRLFHPFLDDGAPDRAFDTILCPYDTGDGQMAAYRAGAGVTNMEFVALSVTPSDHGTAGISGFLSVGCRFRNALGEEFMTRHDPRGEAGPRQIMARACLTEIEEGRGPIYLDTSTLTEQDRHDIHTAWANEVPLVPRYLKQKGTVPGRDWVEVVPSVAAAFGSVLGTKTGETNVAGLYTAGDCSSLCFQGAQGAALTGRRAGRAMDEYLGDLDSLETSRAVEPAAGEIDRLRDDVCAPLRVEGPRSLHWQEVAAELRHVTGAYLGLRRNARSIETARRRLDALWEATSRMRAADPHELMRVHETRNLVRFGRLMAVASAERRESRIGNGEWHLRTDYPETSDAEYSYVVLNKGDDTGGGPTVERLSPALGVEAARAFLSSMPAHGATPAHAGAN